MKNRKHYNHPMSPLTRSTTVKINKKFRLRAIKNQIFAVLLLVIAYLTTIIDNDATVAVFLIALAIPMFFVKD